MLERINQLLTPNYRYSDPLVAQRARILLLFLAVGSLTATISAIVLLIVGTTTATFVSTAIVPIAFFGLGFAVHRGYFRLASTLIVGVTILTGINGTIGNPFDVSVVLWTIPIVLAGTLLGWRSVLGTTVLISIFMAQQTFLTSPADGTQIQATDFIIAVNILGVVALLLVAFGTNVQQAASTFVLNFQRLQDAAIGMNLSSIDAEERDLCADVIDVARDSLAFNYAQVFITGEDGMIRQRIASGLTKAQINVDENVELPDSNAILEAIRTKETIVLTTNSSELRRSHLLPGINYALAIPIVHAGDIIGVLDVQRESAEDLSQVDQTNVETLAAHLGTAIAQARLISDLRENLTEQNNLITRQQARLLEYERAERRTIASTWSSYLEQRGIEYLGFDMDSEVNEPVTAYDFTEVLEPAIQADDVTVTDEGDYQMVVAPISLRGQLLGAMSFKVPKGRQLVGQRQTELIRSVIQRLALALENKRLFEQSQAQAQRERKANEVGNRLLSTTDIESVLKLAVENFNEALGAVQTNIHLRPEAQQTSESEQA